MRSARTMLLAVVAVGLLAGLGGFTLWYSRAFAYLSNDPAACANCHLMNDSFHSWGVSSHREVSCIDCHLPHDTVGKYLAKAESGFRHSYAFTLEEVQVPRANPRSQRHIQENCVRCHENTVAWILQTPARSEVSCTHCHQGVGHVL